MKVFDAHCHLQEPRIWSKAPQLITTVQEVGGVCFAVNGFSENDWHLVKQLSQSYPASVIPCFCLHPLFIQERASSWFDTLKQFFDSTPFAAVGEIVLDKSSRGKHIDFTDQVEVFQQQLQLVRGLKHPASIYCIRAFGDLHPIIQHIGPYPAGVILHSYLGSAKMVPEFAKLGAYFSFSGFLMSMEPRKAPSERILLETDAPDALPKSVLDSLYLVGGDSSNSKEPQTQEGIAVLNSASDASIMLKKTLNHPDNILNVLGYVASLLELTKEEVAEVSYRDAIRLFSYGGP